MLAIKKDNQGKRVAAIQSPEAEGKRRGSLNSGTDDRDLCDDRGKD